MKEKNKGKRVVVSASERVSMLPPYLFAQIDRQKEAARRKGMELIDFGIGDPDLPTPAHIVKAAIEAVKVPANHRYPKGGGSEFFKEAARNWMREQFGVSVDEGLDVGAVIGTKEGIAHVPNFFCNPGDIVLVPNPGYPVYRASAILADAVPVDLPLLRESGFVPDLKAIAREVVDSTRLVFLNYPNNPTGAVLTLDQMEAMVAWARREDVLIISDNSYSHIRFDGRPPASFLQIPGAGDVCLEFHSLSKTFNMTGWRVGFVAGGSNLVRTFMGAKENIDSGVFTAIQKAAETALGSNISGYFDIYARRREVLVEGLRKLDWDVCDSPGTFYVWVKLPRETQSMTFAKKLITHTGIIVTPGSGFGTFGEGYVRFALTIPEDSIHQAIGRLEQKELFSHRIKAWLKKGMK
ncbi:MAG: aminotransferase class I/II-fold pyridoxal phosphate-dependent enzyme [Candidatus Fermentibacteraceae bacterium]|nr:aminotransferase class I/II-fold pyridoxal phosphate-dependent enzyme [Candidatus Fermentibacteraceae bacterium]MBN2608034.1 aminotransferase class I/II-fold pyridoxal phosphate-dependent enzyme [Candidatus Fermentibacteraceae bacterium]